MSALHRHRFQFQIALVLAGIISNPTLRADAVPTFRPFDQLLNISTRAHIGKGQDVLIGGFIVRGNDPKKVIVRAIGPSLSRFGVTDILLDPVLELRDSSGALIAGNDNWHDGAQAEIESTSLAPTSELESAIVQTLSPGAYTAIVRGKDDTTGTGLVEVYDLDQQADSILVNISARGIVNDDNPIIGGFIVGDGGLPFNMVIARAIGPALSNAGVENPLMNPRLELRGSNGELIESNDDWKEGNRHELIASKQLAPADENEAAVAVVLGPGAFTAIVRGQNGASGIALVEFYNVR